MYDYTENTIKLAQALDSIEEVEQVRYHYVIKPRFIKIVGEDGIEFVCFVKKKFTNGGFIKFSILLNKDVYDDLEKHADVIKNMQDRINDYNYNNETPGYF